jgi:uncharacterized protein (DUF934 family)
MRVIDRNLQVVDDSWTLIDDEAALPPGDVIVSLARWQKDREALAAHPSKVAVKLPSDVSLEAVAGDLQSVELIALDFPKFVDGRGYSLARLLRGRYGFAGELRAVGDVQRDQVDFMRRCGIDSFAVRDDKDAAEALKAFSEFSFRYQAAADDAQPVYRRR